MKRAGTVGTRDFKFRRRLELSRNESESSPPPLSPLPLPPLSFHRLAPRSRRGHAFRRRSTDASRPCNLLWGMHLIFFHQPALLAIHRKGKMVLTNKRSTASAVSYSFVADNFRIRWISLFASELTMNRRCWIFRDFIGRPVVVSRTVSLKRRRGDIPLVLEERLMLDSIYSGYTVHLSTSFMDALYETIWHFVSTVVPPNWIDSENVCGCFK